MIVLLIEDMSSDERMVMIYDKTIKDIAISKKLVYTYLLI